MCIRDSALESQLREALGRKAPGDRHRFQLARAVVAPAMVWAHEALGVPASFRAHHRAAVSASVDQYPCLVLAANDDDGLLAHAGGEVVPRLRHLALVAEHEPRPAEDPLHFPV